MHFSKISTNRTSVPVNQTNSTNNSTCTRMTNTMTAYDDIVFGVLLFFFVIIVWSIAFSELMAEDQKDKMTNEELNTRSSRV